MWADGSAFLSLGRDFLSPLCPAGQLPTFRVLHAVLWALNMWTHLASHSLSGRGGVPVSWQEKVYRGQARLALLGSSQPVGQRQSCCTERAA